ncbi:septum formation inhibitor Maf [bacterium]|nr:septum formation inhibitor Maf [bacterium]
MKLILASGSPRRKELLGYFNFDITIIKPTVEEIFNPNDSPEEVAKYLAELKRDSVLQTHGDEIALLAADTIVVLDRKILGKPQDRKDATRMLTQLSGKTHTVLTGVAIAWRGERKSIVVATEVQFKPLSLQEISDYTATDEPYDKAGSYALQGIGAFMVQKINGSHSNVIGLPVAEVITLFQQFKLLSGLSTR